MSLERILFDLLNSNNNNIVFSDNKIVFKKEPDRSLYSTKDNINIKKVPGNGYEIDLCEIIKEHKLFISKSIKDFFELCRHYYDLNKPEEEESNDFFTPYIDDITIFQNLINSFKNGDYSVIIIEEKIEIISPSLNLNENKIIFNDFISIFDYYINILFFFSKELLDKNFDYFDRDNQIIVYNVTGKGIVKIKIIEIYKISIFKSFSEVSTKDVFRLNLDILETLKSNSLKSFIKDVLFDSKKHNSLLDFNEDIFLKINQIINFAKDKKIYANLSKSIEDYYAKDLFKSYTDIRNSYIDLLKNIVAIPAITAAGTVIIDKSETNLNTIVFMIALFLTSMLFCLILLALYRSNKDIKKNFEDIKKEIKDLIFPKLVIDQKEKLEKQIDEMIRRVSILIWFSIIITTLLVFSVILMGMLKINNSKSIKESKKNENSFCQPKH